MINKRLFLHNITVLSSLHKQIFFCFLFFYSVTWIHLYSVCYEYSSYIYSAMMAADKIKHDEDFVGIVLVLQCS